MSSNAQEVDEYQTLYDSSSTGGTGRCTPVAGVTTCNPAGTTFTIAQIVASVDQGMFAHMMGNDPRPSYFHQTNLMSQTTGTVNGEGDGLFYETLNPLLAEYKQDFASNAPIEQLTMAQIATLLTEQSAWAANTSVSGYIEGNQVTITNSATAAATVPLTGITTVGSSYAGTQTGWTSVPAGISPAVTSSITWPASAALAPTITTGTAAWFTVGSAGDFAVTTTGLPTPALTESGALPSGVTLTDNGNGTAALAGTPAAGTGGSYPITITATNGIGTTSAATQSFTLTVDQAPAFTSAATATATVSSPSSFTVTTTGYPAATITDSGALPKGTTFTDANGTATIAGTPTVAGTYTLSLTAANGTSPNATQSLVLTVLAAGGPTITSTATDTGTVGTALTPSFTVTTSGTPAPSLTKTGALPAGVTFTNNANGTTTIAGTPTASGTFTLALTAKNSLGTTTQTLTIRVRA